MLLPTDPRLATLTPPRHCRSEDDCCMPEQSRRSCGARVTYGGGSATCSAAAAAWHQWWQSVHKHTHLSGCTIRATVGHDCEITCTEPVVQSHVRHTQPSQALSRPTKERAAKAAAAVLRAIQLQGEQLAHCVPVGRSRRPARDCLGSAGAGGCSWTTTGCFRGATGSAAAACADAPRRHSTGRVR